MKALQYRKFGTPPELVEIDKPQPGPGQVVLKVTASGACHSDQFIMDLPEDKYIYGIPLTLGHEGAGVVEAIGEGVEEIALGDAFLAYGPRGCGKCNACREGQENYCYHVEMIKSRPPGLGSPGFMAEYVLIDNPKYLVPLNGLDPVANVALTDAGLTPYHAIKGSLHKLSAGSSAVVIGAGGLGHIAIQLLKAMTQAKVIVIDTSAEKLDLAKSLGADFTIKSSPEAPELLAKFNSGENADVVFDFVGIQQTADLAIRLSRRRGDIVIIGVGNAALPVGFRSTPYGTSVRTSHWGTLLELKELVDLAKIGVLRVEIETFSLDEAPRVYEKLRAGLLRGRAVIIP